MSNEEDFQKRISFKGSLDKLISRVLSDYGLGEYLGHKVITVGYEDFNVITETKTKDKYFIKFLADFRDDKGCKRYIKIMKAVNDARISHPKLFESDQGLLHKITLDKARVRLCVMEYVDGDTFYDLKKKPSKDQLKFIVRQAALINQIKIKPMFVYDSWAVVNFLSEYKKVKSHLPKSDLDLIEPVAREFKDLNVADLPFCFVHGDIIDTNLMLDKSGKIFIIDFSVSNYYPRIQELAVMLCDTFFDADRPEDFKANYYLTLSEYQETIKLEEKEVKALPLYLKTAHAMHVIGSTSDIVENGDSEENQHWLSNGRKGLEFTSKFF